ncbi:MAG: S8 family serine peptidase, partial [Thermoplasmatota archaeon]
MPQDPLVFNDRWWSVDLPVHTEDDLYLVHLGAFRFDPKFDSEFIEGLPGHKEGGPLLVQAMDPYSMSRILSCNGEAFELLDIASSSSLVVLPRVDIETLMLSIGPYTRAVVPYNPLFKVEGSLFHKVSALDGEGASSLVIGLYMQPDDHILRELNDLCIGVLNAQPRDGTVSGTFRLRDIMELSGIGAVSHVSMGGNEGPDNDVSADIIDVMEVRNTLSLNGSGQIVAVADTGLDTGLNSTLHRDFQGRIVRVYTYGRPGNWSDADIHVWNSATSSWDYKGGHGTHVAGSVLGNGTSSSGQYMGMAPSAGLVMQSTMNSTGSLSIPAYNTLFSDAYRSGARIQTNSWSTRSSYGNYTWRSWQTDNYIWNNKDFLVLFSAGNRGSNGNYSISTQAVSKNVIAVGASESYRPSISSSANNISEMASFSSMGPTWGDGRVKPDVVAPGTWILSTRSMLVTDFWNHYWGSNSTYQGVNRNYAYNGGTSMSTPIVAGMSTLIAQYFSDIERHSPSAALVKAAVINGARPLDGQWSSIPNNREGWGRVNLSNSLGTVDSEAGRMKYVDNTTGLTTGVTHSRLFTVSNSNSDLVLTLVWSDYPGSNTSSTKLVNDLDLKVITPDGTEYNGNDLVSPYNSTRDSVNNVERVVIPAPRAGTYIVNVTGYSVTAGPQPYAFVLTGSLSDAVGWMEWDKDIVPANGSAANLLLSDSNLTGNGWTRLKVNTTTDTVGEIINLTEMVVGGSPLGIFKGSVKVVTTPPSPGEVSVAGDDYLTATYNESYPERIVTARARVLVPPSISNISHDAVGRTLTYMDGVTVTITGTPGWNAWYDVVGLIGRSEIQAKDDGVVPDTIASDGNYTGSFTVPNLVKGNYTIKGYIRRPLLDPTIGYSSISVRIDTNIPRKPLNLTISVPPQGNSLRLDWDDPGDINLMSYSVMRAVENSPGSGIPGTFSKVHSTPDNRTFYIDTGLMDGTMYFYRVSSYNLLGHDSEPTDWMIGIPFDSQAPWFVLNGPVQGSVLSREVFLNYTTDSDAKYVQFQVAKDREGNMIPDGQWYDLLNDSSPGDGLIWDTRDLPGDLGEGEWFIIRAVTVDEVDNRNVTIPLARYLTDNTPPPLLEIGSDTEIALNISVYHLFGVTEELSSVVISRDDQTVRTMSADNDGNFEAFIELSPGVNELLVSVFDRYGNGPNEAPVSLYLVYDPDDPVAVIADIEAFTSTPFILDGSGSYDVGPESRLAGVTNFTWSLSFWGEDFLLYGPEPGLHLSRPGPLFITLTVTDAAGNSGSEYLQVDVLDDEAPTMEGLGDLNVLEDSLIELKAKGVRDNDPLIEQVGIFLWKISGPQEIIVEGSHVEFKVHTPGRYVVVLSLEDTGGNSISVSFNLTVLDITVPTAMAGND